MSDNIHGRFSRTLQKLIDEEEEKEEGEGKPRKNVRDMFSEAGFSHTGGGKRAICADCYLKPRPCQADNLLEIHAECRPECPFVVKVKERNAVSIQDQTDYVATQKVPGREPSVDIYNRRQMVARRTRQPSIGERLSTLRERNLCQVCKTCPRRILFTPCNHFYSCTSCAEEVEKCMRCHKSIYDKIDIYRS
ncbi:baculoviral IAP repeat-containing protein 7-B-like [Ruditapes philippinarum]|uniref:baculoviral IAP repeat-containing protein 7-B-like n=1 Tax=Ruditapes philippinarum TaxID=129788 RepID=UPI00295AA410|nr:baculoviral IAP repeat-containing protein 7-B-like [Ruditapes philippinarum]